VASSCTNGPFTIATPEEAALTAAASALRALVALQGHLGDFRRWSRELRFACDLESGLPRQQPLCHLRNHVSREGVALEATRGVERALKGIAASYVRLRPLVLAFDGDTLGDAIESLGELALRTQVFVLTLQLCQIGEAFFRETSLYADGIGCTRDAHAQGFPAVHEIEEFFDGIRRGCERTTAIWTPHRRAHATTNLSGTCDDRERDRRYRAAIREAQFAMSAIACDPRVAAFLRTRQSSVRWPAMQSACAHISIALQIRLDVSPDLRVLPEPQTLSSRHALVRPGKQ
jgi:hypothetical protein